MGRGERGEKGSRGVMGKGREAKDEEWEGKGKGGRKGEGTSYRVFRQIKIYDYTLGQIYYLFSLQSDDLFMYLIQFVSDVV